MDPAMLRSLRAPFLDLLAPLTAQGATVSTNLNEAEGSLSLTINIPEGRMLPYSPRDSSHQDRGSGEETSASTCPRLKEYGQAEENSYGRADLMSHTPSPPSTPSIGDSEDDTMSIRGKTFYKPLPLGSDSGIECLSSIPQHHTPNQYSGRGRALYSLVSELTPPSVRPRHSFTLTTKQRPGARSPLPWELSPPRSSSARPNPSTRLRASSPLSWELTPPKSSTRTGSPTATANERRGARSPSLAQLAPPTSSSIRPDLTSSSGTAARPTTSSPVSWGAPPQRSPSSESSLAAFSTKNRARGMSPFSWELSPPRSSAIRPNLSPSRGTRGRPRPRASSPHFRDLSPPRSSSSKISLSASTTRMGNRARPMSPFLWDISPPRSAIRPNISPARGTKGRPRASSPHLWDLSPPRSSSQKQRITASTTRTEDRARAVSPFSWELSPRSSALTPTLSPARGTKGRPRAVSPVSWNLSPPRASSSKQGPTASTSRTETRARTMSPPLRQGSPPRPSSTTTSATSGALPSTTRTKIRPRAVSPLPWELPSEEPSPPKKRRPGRPRKNETTGRGRARGRSGAQGSAKSKAAGTFEMELQYTFSDDEAEERDYADLGGSQCPICNKYGSVRYLLPTCKHSFCKPCLQMWRRKHATCMTCRMVYTGWVKIFT